MPVDSRNKRASAIFPLLPFRVLLPTPDGTVAQADRQQVVFLYSGIQAQAATGKGYILDPVSLILEGYVVR